ncbi:SirB2 family protein [Acidovorax sp. SDU_ACID1]|uniref:SirB2 family protein n=1 Tax=Acidovorax sp. SDU_ACID1 TaxID=3136632 RepID=UPI003872B0AB
MAFTDYYLVIKASHVGLALLSGGLFACRGVGVLLGARAPMAPLVRRGSQVIDTALLTAALLLLATLELNPFATPWLRTKLGFLLAYIVFGSLALRRAQSRAGKALAFIAALVCFATMVTVARTHEPLGVLRIFQETSLSAPAASRMQSFLQRGVAVPCLRLPRARPGEATVSSSNSTFSPLHLPTHEKTPC